MALTRVVSNALNHIFVTETKNVAKMAIYQILPQFLVVSHKVAILVHSYSWYILMILPIASSQLTSSQLASPRIFADDTNITFAASTLIDLENAVNLELRNLQRWLITNRLSLISKFSAPTIAFLAF